MPPDKAVCSLGFLQVTHAVSGIQLHADCQVVFNQHESDSKIRLVVGLNMDRFVPQNEELLEVLESSLRYADLWDQVSLKPSPIREISGPSGFCITLVSIPCRLDAKLIEKHGNEHTSLLRHIESSLPPPIAIQLALVFDSKQPRTKQCLSVPTDTADELILDRVVELTNTTIQTAVSLLDAAFRVFIHGRPLRIPEVCVSGTPTRGLASISPAFSPGYHSCLSDHVQFLTPIVTALVQFSQNCSTMSLGSAFDGLFQGKSDLNDEGRSSRRTNTLCKALEATLFRILEEKAFDPTATRRLQPITSRKEPSIPEESSIGGLLDDVIIGKKEVSAQSIDVEMFSELLEQGYLGHPDSQDKSSIQTPEVSKIGNINERSVMWGAREAVTDTEMLEDVDGSSTLLDLLIDEDILDYQFQLLSDNSPETEQDLLDFIIETDHWWEEELLNHESHQEISHRPSCSECNEKGRPPAYARPVNSQCLFENETWEEMLL